jgi:hypothetical protein
MMDFSRNSQGLNVSGNADDCASANNNFMGGSFGGVNANSMNSNAAGVADQELLRRFRASRAAAGMGGFMDTSNFVGNSAAAGMFPGAAGQGGLNSTAGVSGTGGSTGVMGGPGNNDREEEFLLQLLYARRRRAAQEQLQGMQQHHGGDGMVGTDRSAFADELLRLRQAGNATATTAAMFSDNQDNLNAQQQFQQQQQQMQQFQQGAGLGYGFTGSATAGMFPQSMGMNFNAGAGNAFGMMQAEQMSGAFGGTGRVGFDDYILGTQHHHHPQEAIRAGASEQQRIELSPSRFLALQHQQQQGLAGFGGMGMMDPLGGMGIMGGARKDLKMMDLDKLEKLGDQSGKQNKKRFHKKKPSDMPRRPLSAYNLFFSEERERILKEIDAKDKGEELPSQDGGEDVDKDKKKPKALLRPLLPSEKKRRPHRKTHGKISFRELAQMVGQRWKALSDEKRAYYQDLAKEDMARQKKAMEEYYLKQSEKVKTVDEDEGGETKVKEEDVMASKPLDQTLTAGGAEN